MITFGTLESKRGRLVMCRDVSIPWRWFVVSRRRSNWDSEVTARIHSRLVKTMKNTSSHTIGQDCKFCPIGFRRKWYVASVLSSSLVVAVGNAAHSPNFAFGTPSRTFYFHTGSPYRKTGAFWVHDWLGSPDAHFQLWVFLLRRLGRRSRPAHVQVRFPSQKARLLA